MPLTATFFGAWAGIPLWLTFKRPDSRPNFADAYLGAQAALAEEGQPEPALAA